MSQADLFPIPKNPPMEAGQRYGRLVAVNFVERRGKHKLPVWLFRCECGNATYAFVGNVRKGHTASCGCLHNEQFGDARRKHGMSKTSPEYNVWILMKRRCYNQKDGSYHRYGGRGIRVCDRWINDFSNFIADMGLRPSPDHSIDRINFDGNYEPNNCRWATQKEQQRNKSSNRMITFMGVAMSMMEASERSGISYNLIRTRIHLGWSNERALSGPRGSAAKLTPATQ